MYTSLEFEWDEAKNLANIRKHGISFETARRIFDGPMFNWLDRRREYGEERHLSIGEVEQVQIVVAHTRRAGRTRLISARPASRKERQVYNEYREDI